MQAALIAGVVIAATAILMTAVRYRSLPATIDMNPGMGVFGQRLRRPAIFLLPAIQLALLALAYAASISSAIPISEGGNPATAVAGIDVVCALLFAAQFWLIRCAVSNAS